MGIGLGLVIEAIASVLSTISIVMRFVMRVLYFTSGVIIPVQILPPDVIDILLWNPLLHLVSLTRTSFLLIPPLDGVNLTYPSQASFLLVALGLVAFRAMQRRILAQ
jgi:capsular polysaccharide transport system permease protein